MRRCECVFAKSSTASRKFANHVHLGVFPRQCVNSESSADVGRKMRRIWNVLVSFEVYMCMCVVWGMKWIFLGVVFFLRI